MVRPLRPRQTNDVGRVKPMVSYSSSTSRFMKRERLLYVVPTPPSPDRRRVSIVPGSHCSVFSKSLRKSKTSSISRLTTKVRSTCIDRA